MRGPQRFCTKCGQEFRTGAQFCTKCGQTAAITGPSTAHAGEESGGVGPEVATIIAADAERVAFYRSRPGSEPTGSPEDTIGAASPDPPSGEHLPFPGSNDQRPRPPHHDRSRKLQIIGLATLVLAGLAVAIVLILRPPGHRTASPPAPTPSGTSPTSPPASSPPAPSAQQQAANSLAGLLAQSGNDRVSVSDAYNDVQQCGGHLQQDARTFGTAVTSRQQLLSQLAHLQSLSALPQQMIRSLTSAWQASINADRDFAAWTQDQISGGCSLDSQSDPHYQAANGPDNQATADKTAFAGAWNALAAKYGLTEYRPGQL